MDFKKKLSFVLTGLISSSFIFANNSDNNVDEKACINKDVCPKILEIARAGNIKSENIKPFKLSSKQSHSKETITAKIVSASTLNITNKSKKAVITILAATYKGAKINCAQFSIPGKSTITRSVSCNVPGVPYSLGTSVRPKI
mgnify:FL=1|tara:strand:+ start:160 stop:588 length:429 start_codon:yes stop_codon:yes gene_type:complete